MMTAKRNVEMETGKLSDEVFLYHSSSDEAVMASFQSEATDDNPSSSNNDLGTGSAVRLPSFCNLEGSTGLQPSRKPFDMTVIKRLENMFDDTATEFVEEERLKTFLRIRPSSIGGLEQKTKLAKSQKKIKVLEIIDETTVLINPHKKFVNSCLTRRGRTQAEIRNKKTEFKFTKVLGPQCNQTGVFEECVHPLIDNFLRNENSLVFTYGSTNSGKTYTLQGHGKDYGIIPRTLDAIFCRIQGRLYKQGDFKPHLYQNFYHLRPQEIEILHQKKEEILLEAANMHNELKCLKNNMSYSGSQSSSQGSTVNLVGVDEYSETNYALFANTTMYSVWVSFAELYNEKVYDLLETLIVGKTKRRKERKLLQDANGFVYIKDLTELNVTTDDEAYKIYLAGRKNLQFAATQMNERSSRSHSFFTIRVVSIRVGENLVPYPISVHRMTFCDLAGMERASQTENEGMRLKESSNINSSLTVLLKVIRLLREKQVHNKAIETIPFRESKLTHIFKSYLTSSTHICMIVNVNPDPKMADSTLQVLYNSAIASNVIAFRPMEPEHTQDKQPPPAPKTQGLGKSRAKYHVSDDKENVDPSRVLKPKNKNQDLEQELSSSFSSKSDWDPKGKKVQFSELSSSDNDFDDKDGQTVVATNKFLQQRVAALEQEVMELRWKLEKCEREKQWIRDESVKLLAEQNRLFNERFNEYRHVEENFQKRKLSIIQKSGSGLSPGSKCGRSCTPPKVCLDNIREDGDESSSTDDETDQNISD